MVLRYSVEFSQPALTSKLSPMVSLIITIRKSIGSWRWRKRAVKLMFFPFEQSVTEVLSFSGWALSLGPEFPSNPLWYCYRVCLFKKKSHIYIWDINFFGWRKQRLGSTHWQYSQRLPCDMQTLLRGFKLCSQIETVSGECLESLR